MGFFPTFIAQLLTRLSLLGPNKTNFRTAALMPVYTVLYNFSDPVHCEGTFLFFFLKVWRRVSDMFQNFVSRSLETTRLRMFVQFVMVIK